MKYLVLFLSVLLAGYVFTAQQSSVSQWGMTFYFDTNYEVGTFANGDWWVVGPVQIDSITPHADYGEVTTGAVNTICTGFSAGQNACASWCAANAPAGYVSRCSGPDRGYGVCACSHIRNGWEVNPVVSGGQGFDDRAGSPDAGLIPDLPYTAQGGQSILKVISQPDDPDPGFAKLKTAAILTVVSEIPPDSGKTVFRPPYVGTEKPYYSTSALRTGLIPSLDPVPLATSDDWGNVKLQAIIDRYKKVQLDHKGGVTGRQLHPEEHMPNYGGDIGSNNGDAVLRLCLNESLTEKMPGIIGFVQYGIDIHHMVYIGQTWPGGGGHRPGQLLPLAFAALMLDDAKMKTNLQGPTDTLILHEIKTMYWSEKQGKALYGYFQHTSEDDYWNRLETQSSGAKSMRDIYEYIDGGYTPGGSYQFCCTSQPWKGEALSFMMIPDLFGIWNNRTFFDYVDRWVNFGVVTQPDPCAPLSQGGGHDHNTGTCIKDPDLEYYNSPTDFKCKDGAACGRFPELHGNTPDGGGRYSRFQAEMWDKYRSTADIEDKSQKTRLSDKVLLTLSPNPFDLESGFMTMAWKEPGMENLTVTIYDFKGQEVIRLAAYNPVGAIWDGADSKGQQVKPGVYYLGINVGNNKVVKCFLVIK